MISPSETNNVIGSDNIVFMMLKLTKAHRYDEISNHQVYKHDFKIILK